ncbi:MAG: tetratricopeptide repeat-containing glycosyltransferase family protein [Pseudomonadota bacterium]|nr:tetratricopeptide repeat-containing glycosyltransferase family protein [Pseudomonadota bacterium]
MSNLIADAISAHQAGRLTEAEALYRQILDAEPALADIRYNLGLIHGQLGRPWDAVREISAALESRPDFGQGWFMLCEFADIIEQHELNSFAATQAVRLLPDNPRAWLRHGLAFSRLERPEQAIEAYRRAVDLDPWLVKAWVNLCVTYKSIGRYSEAETAIRRAIAAAGEPIPDETGDEVDEAAFSYLHWHLALIELLSGRYKEGFSHFRARFRGGTDWKRFESDRPLWRGEDLRGKTILVLIEQGFGDAVMLCRYLHWLKADGARVIFQAQPALLPLFAGWPGADEVSAFGARLEASYDYHTAIFDLPHRFGATYETVPRAVPYLSAPPGDTESVLPDAGGLKIGVIWAGQPENTRGRNRSVPLEILAEIFKTKPCQFFSLTRDKRAGDAELIKKLPLTDLGPLLTDFGVTAQFMDQMDLVISCDTATAHLAGALGKTVWTLLPFVPDWRWALEREDNVWYPTMRLFRQSQRDVWQDVVARVAAALGQWVAEGQNE